MKFTPPWLSWPETQTLIQVFSKENNALRFVGGAVRDALIGKTVQDVDAATTLLPEQLIALLKANNIKAIPTGIDHGTVTAVIDKKHFEITTLRKDVATDGRHAKVEYTDNWQEDAKRRDFTMNALMLAPDGELFDYFFGAEDAKEGRIKFIGDAAARIKEDYLRILRFFRFYAHYGKKAPDPIALKACAENASHIPELSTERIQQEMLKLFAAPKSYHAMSFMIEQGIFPHVFGYKITSATTLRRLEEIGTAFSENLTIAAKMIALSDGDGAKSLSTRWKLPNALSSEIEKLHMLKNTMSVALSFPEQKKIIRRYGNDAFKQAVMLAWAFSNEMIDKASPYHAMLIFAREWQAPLFMIGGKDLQALGIDEGKRMGEILKSLEESWEAGDYKASKEELLKQVKP